MKEQGKQSVKEQLQKLDPSIARYEMLQTVATTEAETLSKISELLTRLYQEGLKELENPREALKVVTKVYLQGDTIILDRPELYGTAYRRLKPGQLEELIRMTKSSDEGLLPLAKGIIQQALSFPPHSICQNSVDGTPPSFRQAFKDIDLTSTFHGRLLASEGRVYKCMMAFHVIDNGMNIIACLGEETSEASVDSVPSLGLLLSDETGKAADLANAFSKSLLNKSEEDRIKDMMAIKSTSELAYKLLLTDLKNL